MATETLNILTLILQKNNKMLESTQATAFKAKQLL